MQAIIRTHDYQDEVFVSFNNHSSIVSRTFEKNKKDISSKVHCNLLVLLITLLLRIDYSSQYMVLSRSLLTHE